MAGVTVIITNTIKKLAAAGVSLEAIIIAVETIETEISARRLASTERVRKHRALRNVTQRCETETPSPQVSLSPYNPLTLPNPPTPSEPNGSVSETSSDAPKRRSRKSYSEDFEKFWGLYPTDRNMSKFEAWGVWQKLSSEDRLAATESLTAFRAYCESNADYRPIHANRYLAKRRFEGHLQTAQEKSAARWIKQDEPSWNLWLAYYRDNNRRFSLKSMLSAADQGRAFHVPSEYPPGYVKTTEAA